MAACLEFGIAGVIDKAGLPAGVVNVLAMNHATVEALCAHSKVGMIALTGSVGAAPKCWTTAMRTSRGPRANWAASGPRTSKAMLIGRERHASWSR
ncbi:aldehyde dehydrogenase family protein [Burkholderia sp. SRS-W-2-2016]|uniref:aldehyde dehydrogenase family protein n=1 Tax=Burkholderia sp. SRS-W-2-2016 TaxID=1926878 RepID=UPI00273FFE4F|nr:aldehyde dehydrogenase family protein [Burkholderia sp. SRS-W-2-2016]